LAPDREDPGAQKPDERPAFPVEKNFAWRIEDAFRELSQSFAAEEEAEKERLLSDFPGFVVPPDKQVAIVAQLEEEKDIWHGAVKSLIPGNLAVRYQVPEPAHCMKITSDGALLLRFLSSIKHVPYGRFVLPFHTLDGKGFEELRNPAFVMTDMTFLNGIYMRTSVHLTFSPSKPAMEEMDFGLRISGKKGFLYWEIVNVFGGAYIQEKDCAREEARARIINSETHIVPLRSEPERREGGSPADCWLYFVQNESIGEGTVGVVHDDQLLDLYFYVAKFKAA